MTQEKEEVIRSLEDWKDTLVFVWLYWSLGSFVAVIYGFVFNDTVFLGTGVFTFVVGTVVLMGFFTNYQEKQEELEEEVKIEKLENRIETLEEQLDGENP